MQNEECMMSSPHAKFKPGPSAEHHTKAAECCDKAAEEYRHAAKCCNLSDDEKARKHAKNAEDYCTKALDHGKLAMSL